jgi:hypothetical protein
MMTGYRVGLWCGTAAAAACLLTLPACAGLWGLLSNSVPPGSETASAATAEAAKAVDAALWQWVLYYLGLREFGADAVKATSRVASGWKKKRAARSGTA